MQNEDINEHIADAIMGRPHGFSVEGRHFYLYPATLGRLFFTADLIRNLGLQMVALQKNPVAALLHIAKERKMDCTAIIAYSTCRTKKEIFDSELMSERIRFLANSLPVEDVASLLTAILNEDKTADIMKFYGMDKERDRLSRVIRIKDKDDKNNLSFGGTSHFGTLLDVACERYGWTKDYVVWGIDYCSLRLMLADKVTTVYVTDEQRKHLPAHIVDKDGETIEGTAANMATIKSMDWK